MMASFVIKRVGFGATPPRGQRATLNDAAMTKVFAAYKAAYGQVPVDPAATPVVLRDMTDDEVTDKLFLGLLQGLADTGNAHARISAGKTAQDGVVAFTPAVVPDNT